MTRPPTAAFRLREPKLSPLETSPFSDEEFLGK
jgi:hypothetical protein